MTGAPTGTHWWVTIKDGQGTVTDARSDTGIVEEAPGVYTATRTAPSGLGTYTVIWDNGTVWLAEQLLVTTDQVIPTGQLCSLADVKATDGALANAGTSKDSQINRIILDATDAIQTWTGRQLIVGTGLETRVFTADGLAFMPDMAAAPTLIETLDTPAGAPAAVPAGGWTAGPLTRRPGEPYTSLTIPTARTGYVRVTATWGWPIVPPTVRRACIQTVIHWMRADRSLTNPSPSQYEPGDGFLRDRSARIQWMLPLIALDMLRMYRNPVIA